MIRFNFLNVLLFNIVALFSAVILITEMQSVLYTIIQFSLLIPCYYALKACYYDNAIFVKWITKGKINLLD